MNFLICTRGASSACVTTAFIVLFSVAGFLWALNIGGFIAAAIIYALTVGLAVRYVLDEPVRVKQQVRKRTQALQDLAYRDELTGLPNRRFFTWYVGQYLPRQLLKGHGNALQTQVVLFDLNGFKAVNDTHGHVAGDALLRFISESLLTYLPSDTVLARLGGDEFVVLVRDRRRGRKVQTVVNLIRRAASSTLEFDHKRIRVSASVGVSSPVSGKPVLRNLLREADELMYADKALQKAGTVVQGKRGRSRTRRTHSPCLVNNPG